MHTKNPKVFISHSSDDKDRFVREFARRLRSRGIDAWVDEWEIKPGDSLVDRIFSEGIGQADALIVVLSPKSVKSKWVREEINAAFVQRVEQQRTRLIPVIIEDCDVPVALQSTVYVRVDDVTSYEQDFERIVATIFDANSKPALGPAPAYTTATVNGIPGLNHIDNLALKLACEDVIREGGFFVSASSVWKYAEPMGIPEQEMHDSIRVLHEHGFIEGLLENRPTIEHFKVTLYGFHEYAKAYIPDINDVLARVAACIVNEGMTSSRTIRDATGQPEVIIEYVIELFENQGWLSASGAIGGDFYIADVSPQLKRYLLD